MRRLPTWSKRRAKSSRPSRRCSRAKSTIGLELRRDLGHEAGHLVLHARVRLEAEIEIEDHLVEACALDLGLQRVGNLCRRTDKHGAVGEILRLHGPIAVHDGLEIAVIRRGSPWIARKCRRRTFLMIAKL